MNMIDWFKTLDPNQLTYWLGLGALAVGVGLSVSVATALVVAGAIVVLTSIASSFFTTWLLLREKK